MEKIYINNHIRKEIIYMDPKAMKNMIILKNLPSNIIEEAFVVFKDNVKIHKIENEEKNKNISKGDKAKQKDYIVREAEMVIADYISRIEQKEYEIGNGGKKLKQKYNKLKSLTIFLGIFSVLSLILILFR